jgi:hypothetical protein
MPAGDFGPLVGFRRHRAGRTIRGAARAGANEAPRPHWPVGRSRAAVVTSEGAIENRSTVRLRSGSWVWPGRSRGAKPAPRADALPSPPGVSPVTRVRHHPRFAQACARGQPEARRTVSSARVPRSGNPLCERVSGDAAEGIRILDLLHGKKSAGEGVEHKPACKQAASRPVCDEADVWGFTPIYGGLRTE